MSKDHFSTLFRQSKLASFHPKISQLYFNHTTKGIEDGPHATFGLKRPTPRMKSNDVISIKSLTGPFGMIDHTIQNKDYEAFELLRKITFHVGMNVHDNSSTTKYDHNGLFFKQDSTISEPLFVKGKVLKKLRDGGFLISIQDCWVGLLSQQQIKGIDTRFLVPESSDQSKGIWHNFQVKSFTWIPKSQTAKIYLSLVPNKDLNINADDKNQVSVAYK